MKKKIEENKNIYNFAAIKIPESTPTPIRLKKELFSFYEWVDWGDNNDMPTYLKDMYNYQFITAKSIIKRKVELLASFEKSEDDIINEFFRNNFSKDWVEDILYKALIDYEVTGTCVFEVTWSKSGDKVARIEHIPVELYREHKNNYMSNEKLHYFLCDDWTNTNIYIPKIYQAYDAVPPAIDETQEYIQLLIIKDNNNSNDFYSVPYYFSSLDYIISEYKIAESIKYGLKNNFNAGTVLNFMNGNPDDTQKSQIQREVIDVFTGTENNGKIFVNFCDAEENRLQIEQISNNSSTAQYTELINIIRNSICVGMNIPYPELFGVSLNDGGVQFNSTDHINQMKQIYFETQEWTIRSFERAFNFMIKPNMPSEQIKIKRFRYETPN